MTRTAVVWFRRDLRLADHPGLSAALARADAVAPLFVLDPAILRGRFASSNRTWFMLRSLAALDEGLRVRGSALHVRIGHPAEEVPAFVAEVGADSVHVTRDHAPYGRARDRRVADALPEGVTFHPARGGLIHEPEEVVTDAGSPFVVFTPFHRAWSRLPVREPLPAPDRVPAPSAAGGRRGKGPLPTLSQLGLPDPIADLSLLPEPGEEAARARLDRWLAPGPEGLRPIDGYATARDSLDRDGTSRLSADLRFGLLSPVEVAARAIVAGGPGVERFVAELAWREFYAHGLFHRPALARAAFNARYDAVAWRDDADAVAAWEAGRTGYPVVDAAMRSLRATGWLHNRGRMVAASFLTKDLLVDWRVGEAVFMRHLVDGDPASNNGGWQWTAGVGTDAAPYFRVFNPTSQGKRHDPDGAYIRRWVPELREVPLRYLHAPWTMPPEVQAAARCRIEVDYPAPIVEHGFARARALEAFAATRG